jgi:hypothetical protein
MPKAQNHKGYFCRVNISSTSKWAINGASRPLTHKITNSGLRAGRQQLRAAG